ncbi:hypothetical protein BCR34DRAFT_557245 [Clohesyomyces aquaticus]|uniref:Uncharacterized protein n=1 Tax=Clohesyomyces aquaticus TaxID=1231657 RepID=A0A1Y2A1P7_9PLEO|nr:hypothetical protein BCR34DRAFT_557245 [Clohesyomyces aquaticus]
MATTFSDRELCILSFQPAKTLCTRCEGLNPDHTPHSSHSRLYCNKYCQDDDWPRRKDQCDRPVMEQRRKKCMDAVRRAGDVAQSLFLGFMQQTWTYDMKKVRVGRGEGMGSRGREAEVVRGIGVRAGPGGIKTLMKVGGNWFVKFPEEVFWM